MSKGNLRKYKIKDWPEDERLRERLLKYGAENLSDTQLLAIILRTGEQYSKSNAMDLARTIIDRFGNLRALDYTSTSELLSIKGIGLLKAAEIKTALEIGKRFLREKAESKKRIETCEDVVNYYKGYLRDSKKEFLKLCF